MLVGKKASSRRSNFDFRHQSAYSESKEPRLPPSFEGFIFICSNDTEPDLERKIFGLPIFQAPSVRAIRKGMPLFLFNYSTRCLWGVFEAASDGGLNLDPYAWENTEISRLEKSPVSRYPAQVRVNYKFMRPPLDESTFRPILEHIEGHKFRLELSAFQVKQLLKLFLVPEEAFFGDKSLKLIQSPGIINSLPESPRSIVKLDSDSHSECSSKGTYPGEDDWFEEDQEGKGTIYIPSSEHHVCNFSSMSSDGLPNDKHIYSTSGTPLSHVRSNALTQNQQSTINDGTYRSHFQYQPDTFELRERNGMPLKFCDVDPALNSTPVALKQACAQQLQSDDDPQESPCIAFNQPAPIFSYRNMIYIPVQMPLRKIAISQGKGDDEKNLAGGQPANKQTYRSENLKNIDPELSKFCNHPPNQPFLCHDQILFPFPVLALQPKLIYDPTQVTVIGGHVPHNLMEQDFTVSPSPPHPSETLAEREGAWNHSRLHGGAWHRVSYNPVPFVLSAVPMVPQSLRFPAAGFSEKLHSNILYFARLTRPSIEKQLFVVTAVDCVRNCVRALWSGADVEVYGSFATGLCLQHSDVDLAILNVPLPLLANSSESQASASLLKELGLSLKAAKHCDSINVIANASVPVLKCLFRPTMELSSSLSSLDGISIDITIGDTQRPVCHVHHYLHIYPVCHMVHPSMPIQQMYTLPLYYFGRLSMGSFNIMLEMQMQQTRYLNIAPNCSFPKVANGCCVNSFTRLIKMIICEPESIPANSSEVTAVPYI